MVIGRLVLNAYIPMRLITLEFANWSSVQFSSYAVNKPPGIGFAVNNNNNNNNKNNNNSYDNVYGAVIMTEVIARVHPVHLMNVD